ncbi:ATPase AAA [Erwinia typographi]|uniref:ATPase AAA n=1 Tax=Erwinia typographi TaxID=371042 RepID=A0A0A3ZAP5_9GAMM|nr:AAA family ATPase [Erwinia typographi]KGT94701.1 ATPase AAA [Erwinia typographi]
MSEGQMAASNALHNGKRVVMVNGIPASGKSSIARELATATGWPVLSVDGIKEPFMRQLENVDRALNRRLGIASYQAIWSVIAAAPQGCTFIVDAWFGFQPKESLVGFLHQAQVTAVAEIWCQLPGELAAQRYESRLASRLPGHPGAEYIPELIALAERAEPMRLGPVYIADQTKTVDSGNLLNWTHEVLSTVNYK